MSASSSKAASSSCAFAPACSSSPDCSAAAPLQKGAKRSFALVQELTVVTGIGGKQFIFNPLTQEVVELDGHGWELDTDDGMQIL